jgi:hypothetical protein
MVDWEVSSGTYYLHYQKYFVALLRFKFTVPVCYDSFSGHPRTSPRVQLHVVHLGRHGVQFFPHPPRLVMSMARLGGVEPLSRAVRLLQRVGDLDRLGKGIV